MTAESRRDALSTRLRWEQMDHAWTRQRILDARAEDLEGAGLRVRPVTSGDVSSELLPATASGSAELVARRNMTISGLHLIPLVAEAYEAAWEIELAINDGACVRAGERIARLTGPVRSMLTAERVLLNFLQRLSGIATITRTYLAALGESPTRLLDTRKTTPGFRLLEKYAVACGGGWNHRLGLYDRVMLKDNHLAVSGLQGETLAGLVRRAKAAHADLAVEVEVDRIDQIPPVLEAGADVIMLDNFDDAELREAVALIDGRAATEASGGITIERLPRLAGLGLDFVSTGATVHQASWVDIGLDWAER